MPAGKGLTDAWHERAKNPKFNVRRILLLSAIIMLPLGLHLLDALTPVDYREAAGDIANNYLRVPMTFAAGHGAVESPLVAGNIASFANYELVSSALVVLTNPEIIKLMGFMVFSLAFFIRICFLCKLFSQRTVSYF